MKLSRRIRTMIYNDQRFSDTEIDLLHTPALQRLYELHQLGFTDRVFIDASHSRLHHVLGVVEQADRMLSAIIANLENDRDSKLRYGVDPIIEVTKADVATAAEARRASVRLMALLHDLTHAPYGHTLEDEIELVEEKHDDPKRQAEAYYRLVIQYFGWIERNFDGKPWTIPNRKRPVPENADVKLTDEQCSQLLAWYLDSPELHDPPTSERFLLYLAKRWTPLLTRTSNPSTSMRKISAASVCIFVRNLVFAMRGLLYLDLAHKAEGKAEYHHVPQGEYPVDILLKSLLHEAGIPAIEQDLFQPKRDIYLLDVIGNTICADLLDYAKRDAINSGLRLDYDPDRIMANMTVVEHQQAHSSIQANSSSIEHPFAGLCLRTAVSMFSHKLRIDAAGELLNLLQVRYYVYERVLFHPTKAVAGALLGAAIQWIGWKSLPKHLQFAGDTVFLHQLAEAARLVRELLSGTGVYNSTLVDELDGRLAALPQTAVSTAARQLLKDRLTTSVADILEQLAVLKFLPPNRKAAMALTHEIETLIERKTIDRRTSWSVSLRQTLKKRILSNDSTLAEEISGQMDELFATPIEVLSDQICAGLRFLDRLAARRYPKVIFRLLPDVEKRLGSGHHNFAPEVIAGKFRKAVFRRIAEREIERRASLPIGSIVIHCPRAEGPIKIAEILITDGFDPQIPQLQDIHKLNPDVFGAHQRAVKAQQEMYASTWRLSVSIVPPHDANWRRINRTIGAVLHELLREGVAGVCVNDPFMDRELEVIEQLVSTRTDEVAQPGLNQKTAPLRTSEAVLLNELAKVSGFEAVLEAATRNNGSAAMEQLRKLLIATTKSEQPLIVDTLTEDLTDWETDEKVLAVFGRAFSTRTWTKSNQRKLRDVGRQIAALPIRRKRFIRGRLSSYLAEGAVGSNRSPEEQGRIVTELATFVEEARLVDEKETNN